MCDINILPWGCPYEFALLGKSLSRLTINPPLHVAIDMTDNRSYYEQK